MKILVKRIFKRSAYTIGKLFIDGKYFCDTLEDAERPEKVYGDTAIPKGTYLVALNQSPRFKAILPLLLDVPGYSGVRIHAGNTAKDTEGCILVGQNLKKGYVLNSKKTLNALLKVLTEADKQGEQICIEII